MSIDSKISNDSSSETSLGFHRLQFTFRNYFREPPAYEHVFREASIGRVADREIKIRVSKYLDGNEENTSIHLLHCFRPYYIEEDDIESAVMKFRIWIGDGKELSSEMKHVEMGTNEVNHGWHLNYQVLSRFCEDGALHVNCEVRIDGLRRINGVGIFNFWDPFEGSLKIETSLSPLYVNKQVFLNHCKRFSNDADAIQGHLQLDYIYSSDLEIFFQLLHGVHLNLEPCSDTHKIFMIAFWFQAENVLRSIDYWALSEEHFTTFDEYRLAPRSIERSPIDSHDLFKWLLNNTRNIDYLRTFLKQSAWEEEEGDALKGVAKKFFSFAVSPTRLGKINK